MPIQAFLVRILLIPTQLVLHLAIKVYKETLGWADHDEVITTPFTFVSPNHTILYEKLHPVFADVDESLCLDPQPFLHSNNLHRYVGMGGNADRLSDVMDICRRRHLVLILDAAHMAGAQYKGGPRRAGYRLFRLFFSGSQKSQLEIPG